MLQTHGAEALIFWPRPKMSPRSRRFSPDPFPSRPCRAASTAIADNLPRCSVFALRELTGERVPHGALCPPCRDVIVIELGRDLEKLVSARVRRSAAGRSWAAVLIGGIAMIGAGCGRGVGSGHHGPEEGVRPQMIEAVVSTIQRRVRR